MQNTPGCRHVFWNYVARKRKPKIGGAGVARPPYFRASTFHYVLLSAAKLSQNIECFYGVAVAEGVSVGVEVDVSVGEAVAVAVEVFVVVGVAEGVPWRTMRGASQRA
jgi:hypothetical protein